MIITAGLPRITGLAQPSNLPRTDFWRPDGPVYAIAVNANTVYIGGKFGYVGPRTGGLGLVSAATGVAKPGFPAVNGPVYSADGDGKGGWYIGGSFSTVGGIVRSNLAHILADNTVDPAWNPSLNGSNLVIVASDSTVFVGGAFTRVGSTVRNRIAALDAKTGQPSAWNPSANSGLVASIVPAGELVYVGGSFTSIGGQSRSRIAALSAATGLATTWNPGASAGVVNAIAVSGTNVYLGGTFTTAGGKPRSRIAGLGTASNTALSWIPEANGAVNALAVLDGTVYVAGQFTSIGSDSRMGLAALDPSSGVATAWNPAPSASVYSMLVLGTNMWVGGAFTSVGGQSRTQLASVDPVTGEVSDWNPRLSGGSSQVLAIASDGNEVLGGGTFASMGGVIRSNLAAFDISTGRATDWTPNPNGAVYALTMGTNAIYAGGIFTSIAGVERKRLAAIHPTTGEAGSFDPNVLGRSSVGVFALALDDIGTLYVGGNFTNIGGVTRNSLAAFKAGTIAEWDPDVRAASASTSASVNALALDSDSLYAGGDFVSMGGTPRARIAALSLKTGRPSTWNPGASNVVYTLALLDTNLYVGGSFTNIGGQTRSRVAALSTVTGSATTWNPNPGGTSPQVRTLAVAGKSIYLGGEFKQAGGEFRNRAAGLSLQSGQAHNWNPDPNDLVRVIHRTVDAFYLGGDFTTVGGVSQTYFAVLPAPTTVQPASLVMQPDGTVTGTVIAADGSRVTVQATSDFASWSTVSEAEPNGFPINFTDSSAAGIPYRYYRAALETE